MVRRSVATHSFHVVVVLAVLLLAAAAPALAADGVRLLPTTDPLAADWQSQPQVSGPIVVFCATPGGGDQTVYACNAGAVSRAPWSMRALSGGGLLMGTQLQPASSLGAPWYASSGRSTTTRTSSTSTSGRARRAASPQSASR